MIRYQLLAINFIQMTIHFRYILHFMLPSKDLHTKYVLLKEKNVVENVVNIY